MKITRRKFTRAIGAGFALTVLGCSDKGDSDSSDVAKRGKLVLPEAPFFVGEPEQYRKPGVYRGYRRSHGIWLVSDGKQLVALSAACTHNGCGTRYDSMSKVFKCPCHNSIFSIEGLNHSGSRAKRPLERCGIALVRKSGGAAPKLRVDPTKRYRQEIDNPISGRNWSSPHSVYLFEPTEG